MVTQTIGIDGQTMEIGKETRTFLNKKNANVGRNDLIFGTSMRHLFTKDVSNQDYQIDKKIFNRRVVWNDRDNTPLGVVSPRYIPVAHATVLEAMDKALVDGGYDASKLKIYYEANANKSRMTATIVDLDKVKMGDNGDEWFIGMGIKHGMDGIHPIEYALSLLRKVCENGMHMKRMLGGVSRKTHVGSVEAISEFLFTGMSETISKIPKIAVELNTLERKRIAKKEFLEMVEKRFGKRFSNDVSEYMVKPADNNPLYAVADDTLSGYDALSLVTFVNRQRSINLNYAGIDNRFIAIEKMVEGWA